MKRFRTILLAFVVVGYAGSTMHPDAASFFKDERDLKKVEEVRLGKRTEANAAWWGFDENDATSAIQSAINSGAHRVIIPNVGKDWMVRPITLAGDQEIVFERGVVVAAKKGRFKRTTDCLFKAVNKSNLTLRGAGATLRMQKADYTSPDYEKSEWRHGLSFKSCNNVEVSGLTVRDTGGDGIYVGRETKSQPFCRDLRIRNVICDNNRRQGISVIGAVNLLIENSIFKNTNGTPPQEGIDLEPNQPDERLVNCVIRNCIFENNRSTGIGFYLRNLSSKSEDLSVIIKNCVVRGPEGGGMRLSALKDDGPKGRIEIKNCVFENLAGRGLAVADKSAEAALLRFANCVWKDVSLKDAQSSTHSMTMAPIVISASRPDVTKRPGGIEFADCVLIDGADRAFLAARVTKSESVLSDVRGTFAVRNPHGARMTLPDKTEGVELKAVANGSVKSAAKGAAGDQPRN